MRILAFDTATGATTVALCDGDAPPLEARDDPEPGTRPRHTTRLMSLIAEVLDGGGCSWEALDRIAVGIGPGTFTGLRIGVSTARALARARGIELLGVSTLESLALAASDDAPEAVVAVLDARRGEVFAAAWETSGQALGQRLLEPVALTPETLAIRAAQLGARRLMVGDGAVAFRTVLEGSGTSIPDDRSRLHSVDATFHCRLASHATGAASGDVRPEYLRLPDAELAQQTAGTQ